MNKVEILAPAGSIEAFYSAIHHGADAVYFGGKAFGARASADNFSNEDIIERIKYAHLMGVKVYVTVNTLIKDSEFDEAIDFVRFLYQHDVDAIIVQDLGLLDVVRQMFPDLDIHVSTQMNVHSFEQAQFLKNLGVKRIVLAREVSLDVVKKIATIPDLELEVFVHGALCMSYSGNCYLSSMIGGRSGNRGRCAQPCRLEYTLESKDSEYYLSTKDLMTLDQLDDIVRAGVHSLKIEGRLKRPEYVGLTVRSYKRALEKKLVGNEKTDLAHMFNREFTRGFMNKETNASISNTKSPNHLGVVCGKVIKTKNRDAYIKLSDSLNNKDSIRFYSKQIDAITINNNMMVGNKTVGNASSGEVVCVRTHFPIEVGSVVVKTTNNRLMEEIQSVSEKKIPVTGKVYLKDQKLVFELTDGINLVSSVSEMEVQPSSNPDFVERLKSQLTKMSQSPFVLETLEVDAENIFLPIKDINELRRQAVEALSQKRVERAPRRECELKNPHVEVKTSRNLMAKVTTKAQLDVALQVGFDEIFVEDKKLKNEQEDRVSFISSRIQAGFVETDASATLGTLENATYSSIYLNVMNARSVYFLHRLGVKTVGLSMEITKTEIKELVDTYIRLYGTRPNVSVMVYGHYELMIMKHCLINKALGINQMGCNRCREELFYLTDSSNNRYPLRDDGKCNLRMFSERPLHLLSYMGELEKSGVSNFILDFSIEEDGMDIMKAYAQYFKYKKIDKTFEQTMIGHMEEGVI